MKNQAAQRKQTTLFTESRPELSPEENFSRFLEALTYYEVMRAPGSGYRFDPKVCVVSKSAPFTFSVRVTQCTVGTLIHGRTSPSSFGGVAAVEAENYVQLLFLIRGKAFFKMKNRTMPLLCDTVLIRDPAVPFVFTARTECDWFSMTVPADYFRAHTSSPPLAYFGEPIALRESSGRLLKHVMHLLCTALDTLDPRDAGDACDGLLCFLRPALMHRYRERRLAEGAGRHELLRNDAENVMIKWMGRPGVTMREIAEYCGISQRLLTVIFSEIGTTPAAHLMRLRLDHAAVYLREAHTKELSVREIAEVCGFRSAAHFSRAFKYRYGMTPREARKQSLLEQSNCNCS